MFYQSKNNSKKRAFQCLFFNKKHMSPKNFEKFNPSAEMEGKKKSREKLSIFKNKLLKRLVIPATVAYLAFAPSFKLQAQETELPVDKPAKEKTGKDLPMTWQQLEEQIKKKIKLPKLETTFLQENDKGEAEFNYWSILAPVQLEFSRETKSQNEVIANLPYEYARLFDSAAPLREKDKEKIINNIDQELKNQLGEELIGLDWSQRVHTHHKRKQMPSLTEIDYITLVGTTSPEGPELKGPKTIGPDAIDSENLQLGELRAKNMESVVNKYLQKKGIKITKSGKENMDMTNPANIKSHEIQFTPKEMEQLAGIARELKVTGADDMEMVYNLIRMYNDDRIDKPILAKQLDKLIAGKRSVVVKLGYENKKDQTLLVPVPLLLLLPLILRRRKNKNQPPNEPTVPPTEPEIPPTEAETPPAEGMPEPTAETLMPIPLENETPLSPEKITNTIPENVTPLSPEEITNTINELPQILVGTKLPSPESSEYKNMEEATVCDDLNVFWNDPKVVSRGLNYQGLTDEMKTSYNSFEDNGQRELFLAYKILKAWESNDKLCRKEAGVSNEHLNDYLDYEKQPQQILWSKMHARKMLELIETQKKSADKSIDDLLTEEAIKLQLRRFEKNQN